MTCNVCAGRGFYPIFTVQGAHAYDIVCPECHGYSMEEDAVVGEQPDPTVVQMDLFRAQKQKNPPEAGSG